MLIWKVAFAKYADKLHCLLDMKPDVVEVGRKSHACHLLLSERAEAIFSQKQAYGVEADFLFVCIWINQSVCVLSCWFENYLPDACCGPHLS